MRLHGDRREHWPVDVVVSSIIGLQDPAFNMVLASLHLGTDSLLHSASVDVLELDCPSMEMLEDGDNMGLGHHL